MSERHQFRLSSSAFGDMMQDLRFAVRMLQKQPLLAFALVATLAFGIGSTTAIFAVVNAIVIRPLPYSDSSALVRLVHSIGGKEQPFFSDAIYATYLETGQTTQDVGVWMPERTATITGLGDPTEVRALTASRGLLTTLGVPPTLGRWFSETDDTPGAPDTVILSHGYWQRVFGSDREILDRVLQVNSRPHQIIGVMPAGFAFSSSADVFLPLRLDPARPLPVFRLLGIARLKRGVTLEQANADSTRVLQMWVVASGTDKNVRGRYLGALRPLKEDVVGNTGTTLWILLGAVGSVLLIACANVANLLLVRSEARRHEFAVRAALGAETSRIARQLLTESVTLAVAGGLLGIGLAYALVRVLVVMAPVNLPRLSEVSIDPAVLGFVVVISLMSAMLFGIAPILKYATPRLGDVLAQVALGISLTRERQRSQQLLVVIQMALAVVLLISAGLMIRSFQELRRVEPGFTQPDRVQTFSISIPPTVVADPGRTTLMYQEIMDKTAAIPGVTSASFTTRLPMAAERRSAALAAAGKPDNGETPVNHQVKLVSPGMFSTLGTPLVAGRDFTWSDIYDTRDVAILSENLATELWGSPAAALGNRVREYYDPSGAWYEVIGVSGNVHDDGAHRPAPSTIYLPVRSYAQLFGIRRYLSRRVSFALRTDRTGQESLLTDVRQALGSVHPTLPVADTQSLAEAYDRSTAQTSFTLVLLAFAGALALLLAMVGLYGTLAYAASRRRREIAIRLALGATYTQIQRLFVRRGLILAIVGTAFGLGGAVAFARIIQSLIFGISPVDTTTFAAAVITLTAAVLLASYLSTRHVLSIDPAENLRAN